jgi:ADP-dependent NAD(P)H-hydrate dehydratase / NAD(P)H-hydrate epimerase
VKAYRVSDVRSAESAALSAGPGGALMQRAAAALAAACATVLRRTGRVSGRRVVLLVGSGSNGGDALWAGARLRARGAAVTAVLTSDHPHAEGLAALRATGGTTIRAVAGEPVEETLESADLVVDGLVGLGGRPGLTAPVAALVSAVPVWVPVVAVDLPSGVDPDTGELPSAHVTASLTVTFGAAKPCLLLPPASVAAGEVIEVDLGFDLPGAPLVENLSADDVATLWPVPAASDDKYRRGVLGVVAGSAGYPGAAVLAVSGAVRAGLGMLRYLGPDDVTSAVRSAWPEVVAGPGRVQAWLLGSGVNPDADDDQPARIRAALESGEPAVVDAGALGLLPAAAASCLLTPHAGELARLLDVSRDEVEARPYAHAAAAAAKTGATVLLKGATTLVVRPDGRARAVAEAPPWLATAGAGDVLAGIAGALLACGLSPFDAGSVAAWVHGRAATLASSGGPIVSGDVAEAVPVVVAGLLA